MNRLKAAAYVLLERFFLRTGMVRAANWARNRLERLLPVIAFIIALAAAELFRATAIVGLISIAATPIVIIRSAWSATP